jgi:orotate phosphoribosyltransferase
MNPLDYKNKFIDFAIENNILQFGNFKTKSGRNSPYFFNTGNFSDSKSLFRIGKFYSRAIIDSKIEFDTVFGPAYKGIPLVTSASIALLENGKNCKVSFNRKERKNHGDSGIIFGSCPNDRVIILDDVITSGFSINESKNLIESFDGKVQAIYVSLDRMEVDDHGISAIKHISKLYDLPVFSIITIENVIDYLSQIKKYKSRVENIREYVKKFS